MGTWAILFTPGLLHSWALRESGSRERHWICTNANCGGLSLGALLSFACEDGGNQYVQRGFLWQVGAKARFSRSPRWGWFQLSQRALPSLCCSVLLGHRQKDGAGSGQVPHLWFPEAACCSAFYRVYYGVGGVETGLQQLASKSRGLKNQSCWFLLQHGSFCSPCWS